MSAVDDSDVPVRTPVPPLRIHHILVATAVTAVFMSFAQASQRQDSVNLSSFMRTGMGITYAIGTSLALTAVGFGFYWRRNGVRFFHQPGHWLLIKKSLGAWFIVLIASSLVGPSPSRSGWVFGLALWGINLAALGICVWAAWRIADTAWWKVLFVVEGLIIVGMFALPILIFGSAYLFAYVYFGMQLLVLVLLAAAAIADRRSHRPRDWPHWLGVFIDITVYVVAIVPQIVGLISLAL